MFARFLRENPACELVAVCDERPSKLAEVTAAEGFADFQEMLDRVRPDVVAIITPGPMHGPQAIMALEAGANVLVETPNVYSVDEADEIVRLTRAKGLKYMLAEDYVYMDWCRQVGAIVHSGKLGDIIAASAEYTHDCRGFSLADEAGNIVPWSRRGEPGIQPLWRLSGLPPLAYSSHTLGPLLAVMRDRCKSVSAQVGGRHQVAGLDVFPLETAVMDTVGGRVVSLTNGFILGHPVGFTFTFYGTQGAIRLTDFGGLTGMIASDDEGSAWRELVLPGVTNLSGGTAHVQEMVNDYIAAVVNNTPPPFDEARSMDFCLPGVLAHESAKRGGEKLAVPLF